MRECVNFFFRQKKQFPVKLCHYKCFTNQIQSWKAITPFRDNDNKLRKINVLESASGVKKNTNSSDKKLELCLNRNLDAEKIQEKDIYTYVSLNNGRRKTEDEKSNDVTNQHRLVSASELRLRFIDILSRNKHEVKISSTFH